MLAPTQKPNDIIQICVTRKCDLHSCSNCTQLLPFRQDAVEMSPEVFRLALRSLAGWRGVRAMFGGNPCTHSRFEDLCQILVEEVPDQRQRGLWANSLRGKGEVVKRTFWPNGRFNLNVHADPAAAAEIDQWLPGRVIESSRSRLSWHSPILLHYADAGLTEQQWIAAREDCDINQNWSAAIVERDGKPYAYFCEVAAALDGVRGENHGVLAEPGWWRWGMDRFAHQVTGCCDRGCGVPLRRRGHLDRDDTYDVSPGMVQLTIKKRGKINIAVGVGDESVEEMTDYQRLRT